MKKIRITLVGGGTGLSVLARGLRKYPVDISAIVSVADDGGSTGIIRDQIDMPAPGDIRNVMTALSDVETKLENLFAYRFRKEALGGHALGNLMLAAMYDMTGDFAVAVKELSKILNVKGTVIPSTNISPKLAARMADNSIIVGESYIPEVKQKIEEVYLIPNDTVATPEAIEAIEKSDVIVFGPGSLYTSIIPNLIPEGMKEAIGKARGIKVYVSNIMTQIGETVGYSAADHLDAINKHMGHNAIDFIILNEEDIKGRISDYYNRNDMTTVESDRERLKEMGATVVTDHRLVEIDAEGAVRHDNKVLAEIIYDIALREISTLQYKK
ncbi:YvcK family protein [Salinicoccus sp. ID82-1]|uniref:Gluconeogenesis factor n=1 Tax=Salinicoccus cyprini TaxID=2493691 RepID=A0A558ARC5_9STAP|nr:MULTISPECIES: uridine diphosphate-N-acetylglucosamine-binding protein YvcK [Salinicoccus]MCG1010158.1 YvcK family protein [Salinicoccus sp. ID82-1]TVT26786.1 uridine diphosphate-N-acetylglucosamine-binding protein YvcK [Salinicoccus cyprini]